MSNHPCALTGPRTEFSCIEVNFFGSIFSLTPLADTGNFCIKWMFFTPNGSLPSIFTGARTEPTEVITFSLKVGRPNKKHLVARFTFTLDLFSGIAWVRKHICSVPLMKTHSGTKSTPASFCFVGFYFKFDIALGALFCCASLEGLVRTRPATVGLRGMGWGKGDLTRLAYAVVNVFALVINRAFMATKDNVFVSTCDLFTALWTNSFRHKKSPIGKDRLLAEGAPLPIGD